MTDAMSSNDIDRVLANIRKLVSVEEDAQPGSGGRLVLTSDLRVDESTDLPAPEEAVDAEDVVSTEAGWPDLDRPNPAKEQSPTFEVVTGRSARPKSLEDRIADLQAAIGQDHPGDLEPNKSEDQAQHLPQRVSPVRPTRPGAPVPLRPLGVDAEPEEAADLADDDPIVPEGEGASGTRPLSDTSGLRFFHSDPADRFDRPDYAGRDDPLEPAEDEQPLDEDALRDLVAEIVREELAGALGERITRNVRKLVRREIMRTLSTRDLE